MALAVDPEVEALVVAAAPEVMAEVIDRVDFTDPSILIFISHSLGLEDLSLDTGMVEVVLEDCSVYY